MQINKNKNQNHDTPQIIHTVIMPVYSEIKDEDITFIKQYNHYFDSTYFNELWLILKVYCEILYGNLIKNGSQISFFKNKCSP